MVLPMLPVLYSLESISVSLGYTAANYSDMIGQNGMGTQNKHIRSRHQPQSPIYIGK